VKEPKTPAAQETGKDAATDRTASAHMQARILAEAIPHLIRYDEQTVVVKFGGHAMGDDALATAFAKDIVYLKQSGINPVVVHGGGPQIASMLKKLEITSDFVHGLRVTDKPTVEVVEMVLCGKINKEIVSAINRQGGKAVGISGKDANLMIAKKITEMPDPQSNLMQADRKSTTRTSSKSFRSPILSRSSPPSGSAATARRSTSTPTHLRPPLPRVCRLSAFCC